MCQWAHWAERTRASSCFSEETGADLNPARFRTRLQQRSMIRAPPFAHMTLPPMERENSCAHLGR
eukprot:3815314-Pyramimonas_sp.AAC.1